MLKLLLRIAATLQIALGVAYLILPGPFLKVIGHSVAAPDLFYPLGMLSSRFLVYGLGLWIASFHPARHVLWIRLMACIQAIDFLVGIAYTAKGVVPLSLSGFAMFNALWIGLTLGLMRIERPELSERAHA